MPIINISQIARSEIKTFTRLNNNSFAFSTLHHGAKIISSQKYDSQKSFKNKYLNSETTAVAFSLDAKLIAFATSTHLHIANFNDKTVIKSIYTDHEELTILSFDLSSQYIVAGNTQGRVLLYRYNISSKISRLCSFPYQRPKIRVKKNFVSSMAFYKNLLAVSGYGGAIFILDLYTGALKSVLLHATFRKNALHFIDDETIVSGDSDGTIQFISLSQNIVKKSINLPLRKIEQIIAIPKTNYLIVHSGTNVLTIIDAINYKILHNSYMKLEDAIFSLAAMDSNNLIVCLKNRKILHIELPSCQKLNSLILHNSLPEAFELLEREPMLQNSKEHKSLQKIYDDTYKEAANALINQNIALANQLMSTYKDVASKRESIRLLFKSFENYNRFKMLYLEKKYALCYAMCSKFPALKITKQYESMERRWKEAFTNAQRHILLNQPDYAKALFKEYITVTSKRPIIELILKHNEQFVDFLKAFEKKDLKKINEISLQNELFTQMPIYKTLESDIENSIYRIEAYIKRNKLELARKSIDKMIGTHRFQHKSEELYAKCDEMAKLQKLYEKNNFYACYEFIDKHPHLLTSELGELLQNHYSKLINKCEDYASSGNIQSIKSTLGELITLSSTKDRVGDLLRVSFQVQIKYFLSKRKYRSAQSIIYSYIDIFTKDKEISSLMKSYESLTRKKLAITQSELNKKSRYSWMESSLITD